MNRVAVIGSINMDLVVDCERLPVPGETVLARGAQEVPGGKGANQAVAAARAGASTIMLGRLGADAFAPKLQAGLASSGVGTDFITQIPGQLSGLAVIGVEDSGENSIMVAPGANSQLTPGDVEAFRDEIAEADVLVMQLEIPLDAVGAAMRIARRSGTLVLLDPAPAPSERPEFVWAADILCPNEAEASALLGRAIESKEAAAEAAQEICRRGVKYAIVTLGAQGVVCCVSESAKPQEKNAPAVFFIDPLPIQAVDSTAAGDAFAGALASCWPADVVNACSATSLEPAIKFACAAGALAASRPGAQPSLPTEAEIRDLLHRQLKR